MIISRWILSRMRNVWDKSCGENRNTHFMFNNFFPTIVPFMSCFNWRYNPLWVCILQPSGGAIAFSRTRFIDHTQRCATVGRTTLDEWSVRRRDLYLTTHNTQQTNIHAPGGIRTHDRSRRAAVDLRLRPRGCWDRPVYEVMWKNIVELDMPQTTVWPMRIVCLITKATNTQSESIYHTFCFSATSMVMRTRLNVTLYAHCLSCYLYHYRQPLFNIGPNHAGSL